MGMKLYDFDGMFDKKLSQYISKNSGLHSEEEWEDIIPAMYSKFGDTQIKSLGTSPRGYYGAMSDEQLIKCLRAHVKNSVPVSRFLCEAIESRPGCRPALVDILNGEEEGLMQYAVNILGAADEAIPAYMRILSCEEVDDDEDFKNLCADFVKEKADLAKEQALECYARGVRKPLMLEILSSVKSHDDRIFDILIKEFRMGENVPMMAGYLASYGDERALSYLLDKISEDGITYDEFQELKYAIEALGGECDGERDFSQDKVYQLVQEHNRADADIFSAFTQGAEGQQGADKK